MHAEQSGFPSGTLQTMPLPADPAQIRAYLSALADARFERVTGVDWFRLPFPGDRQNWTMRGLDDVLAGRALTTDTEQLEAARESAASARPKVSAEAAGGHRRPDGTVQSSRRAENAVFCGLNHERPGICLGFA